MASGERDHFAHPSDTEPPSKPIRQLNDRFRQQLIGGRVLITSGVEALGLMAVTQILERVRDFEAFDRDNDPYDEHDFGSLAHLGSTIFWKIDYYACDLMHGSPDPSDPSVTTRVLTIMLAQEY